MLAYVLLSIFVVTCNAHSPLDFLQTLERRGKHPCPPGTYVTDEFCVECLPGMFSNQENVRQCTECPLNQVAANAGARECMWCAPLMHAPKTGQFACIECLPEDVIPMNSYCFIAAY